MKEAVQSSEKVSLFQGDKKYLNSKVQSYSTSASNSRAVGLTLEYALEGLSEHHGKLQAWDEKKQQSENARNKSENFEKKFSSMQTCKRRSGRCNTQKPKQTNNPMQKMSYVVTEEAGGEQGSEAGALREK